MQNNFFDSINVKSGKTTYNSFDINPLIPLSRQKFSLQEDILQVDYGDYLIDIGWRPEINTKGKFVIKLVYNFDWINFVRRIEAKNLAALKVGLQKMIDYCEALKARNNI